MTGRATFPEASPAELVNWRKLVAAALWTARTPAEHKVLFKARKRTRGHNFPAGQHVVGSPFDRLCRLANVWGSLAVREREARAEELAAVAQACLAVVGEAGAETVSASRPAAASTPAFTDRDAREADERYQRPDIFG